MTSRVLQEEPRLSRRRWSFAFGVDATIALLTFLIMTGVALLGALPLDWPWPVPATAPPTEFSSARALEHIRAIAQQPHLMGSPANAAVRDYLVRELTALGLQPEVQKVTAVNFLYGVFTAGTPENVVARLEGTAEGGKAFLLMAHYDSMPASLGASDGGAGVAAMLETLRAIKAGPPLRNDVIFLFTDGEERGLLGARAFVDSHPWAKDVGVVLNLAARGYTGPAYMFQTSDESGWIVQEVAKAAPYPLATSDAVALFKLTGGDTDLSVFLDAGWAGLNVEYTQGYTHYHTRLDNAEQLDERSLQHLGSYALALTRHFGKVSLDQPKAPDAIYFNLFRFLVHYPQGWAIPFMVLVALLFVAVVAFGFRSRQLTLGGIVLGFLALLGSMIGATLGSYLLWTLIRVRYPGEHIAALEYQAPLFWIGFASLAVAIAAALYVGFRKKIQGANLAVGALLWWLLLTMATSIGFPPASYNFTWPLFFSLLGLAAHFALGDQMASSWRRFAALTLSAIPAVFLFASTIYGVTLIRGLFEPNAVPVFALAIGLLLGLLIPHLDLVVRPNQWVLPGAAAALGLGLLLVGSLTAGFDARHPKPANIYYALNADTQQAIWASDYLLDAWTAQFLGADAKKGSLADYLDEREALHSQAPTVVLAAPNVALAGDRTRDGVRTLRMRVTAPPKANFVVMADAAAHVVGVEIDGKRVSEELLNKKRGLSAWTLMYWNPPAEGVNLTLEVKSTEPLIITVRAETPGLPTIPGRSYQARPSNMMTQHEAEDMTLVRKSFLFPAHP
jgi:Peptidase family M28